MLIVSKNIEIIYKRIGDHQYKGALFCNANRALISIIGFTISKKKRKVLLATCNMFFVHENQSQDSDFLPTL